MTAAGLTRRLPQARSDRLTRPWRALWPLVAILLLQAVVSVSLRNTAFQDEALYLYAGRQYFDRLQGGPPVTEPYALYFSGQPHLYPVLAGALDAWGGLEAARLFSLLCLLATTCAAYFLTRRLFGRPAALPAAALFAVQGSVLFLGHFATFDAPCLLLLALAAVAALRAGRARSPLAAAPVGLLLLLAAATKYAGLLFLPSVLGLLLWSAARSRGAGQALLRPAIAVVALALGAWAMAELDPTFVAGLRGTTTNRVAFLVTPREELALRAAALGAGMTLLGLCGVFTSVSRKRLPVALLLLASALLAPAYHIYKMEATSMHKHIAFGLFFAAPLAGLAAARLGDLYRRSPNPARSLAPLALCLVLLGVGQAQARTLFGEWADSDPLIRFLKTQVRPGMGPILAEDSEAPRYYLQGIVSHWQWHNLYWFEYPAGADDRLFGEPAYKQAIRDRYFDMVVLRYGARAALAKAIDPGLNEGAGYRLVAKLPYYTPFGNGDYWVWRRIGPPRNDAKEERGLRPNALVSRSHNAEDADSRSHLQ